MATASRWQGSKELIDIFAAVVAQPLYPVEDQLAVLSTAGYRSTVMTAYHRECTSSSLELLDIILLAIVDIRIGEWISGAGTRPGTPFWRAHGLCGG